jgi:hypothetical protein
MIHRDVKPSNCFLDAHGRVKVGDFGLSKSLVGESHLTHTGAFLGTPLYASPEQVRGEAVDEQTDVYSVAATLYFLLAGRAPFQTGDMTATLARIVSEDPPPLRSLRPELPGALDRAIRRGLERDRKRRWQDLEEFRQALLPFLPGQVSVGGLSLRFAAYVIDWVLLRFLIVGLNLSLKATSPGPPGRNKLVLMASLVPTLMAILYFGLFEGALATSPGKRLLRLRVCRADGGERPGFARALLRAALFVLLVQAGSLATQGYVLAFVSPGTGGGASQVELNGGSPLDFIIAAALEWGGYLAGLAAMFSTMRPRNGYIGLHEFLSGTRVIQLPWPRRQRGLHAPAYQLQLRRPEGLPARLGPFKVQGALWWTDDEKTLVAEDPQLKRGVWVWLRPLDEPPLDPARRDITRPSRLRWLASGREGDWQWDAFLAPQGCPLPTALAGGKKLAWADARGILQQLTDELAASCAEKTLPTSLSPHQVWVDGHGRVQLLGTPLTGLGDRVWSPRGEVGLPAADGAAQQTQALGFLREIAVLLLEGRPRAAGRADDPVRAPLPVHAATMLERLLGTRRPYATVQEVQADFAATRDLPPRLSRSLRVGHLALQAALLSPAALVLLILPVFLGMYMTIVQLGPNLDDSAEPSDHELERTFAAADRLFAEYGPTLFLGAAAIPLVWAIWAGATRGGVSLRLMGLSLVRADGRPVGRLRAFWRGLVTWTPSVLALSGWWWGPPLIDHLFYLTVEPRGDLPLWALTFVLVTGLLLLLWTLQILHAVVWPRRGLHDLLAATQVTPN